MPESIIQKVETLADRDKAESGINFKDRKKEICDWENDDYNVNDESTAQEIAPYPEITTEFPVILRQKKMEQ